MWKKTLSIIALVCAISPVLMAADCDGDDIDDETGEVVNVQYQYWGATELHWYSCNGLESRSFPAPTDGSFDDCPPKKTTDITFDVVGPGAVSCFISARNDTDRRSGEGEKTCKIPAWEPEPTIKR